LNLLWSVECYQGNIFTLLLVLDIGIDVELRKALQEIYSRVQAQIKFCCRRGGRPPGPCFWGCFSCFLRIKQLLQWQRNPQFSPFQSIVSSFFGDFNFPDNIRRFVPYHCVPVIKKCNSLFPIAFLPIKSFTWQPSLDSLTAFTSILGLSPTLCSLCKRRDKPQKPLAKEILLKF